MRTHTPFGPRDMRAYESFLLKVDAFRKVRKVAGRRKHISPDGHPKDVEMRSPGMPTGGPKSPRAPRSRALSRLHVSAIAGERFRAKMIMGSAVSHCVLGPAGIVRGKREGDGATPAGAYRLRHFLFRADRGPRPVSQLPASRIAQRDGWCDDPRRAAYNRPVSLPFMGGHERLWRDDRLYNMVVVIDYNLRPALKGRGSAIFLHVQASAGTPTAGCIAVEPAVLRRLLGRVGPRTRLVIA